MSLQGVMKTHGSKTPISGGFKARTDKTIQGTETAVANFNKAYLNSKLPSETKISIGDNYDPLQASLKFKNGEEIKTLDTDHDGKIDKITVKNEPRIIDGKKYLIDEAIEDYNADGKTDLYKLNAKRNGEVVYSKTYYEKQTQSLIFDNKKSDFIYSNQGKGLFHTGNFKDEYVRNWKMLYTKNGLTPKTIQEHLKATGIDIEKEKKEIEALFPIQNSVELPNSNSWNPSFDI